MKSSTAITVGVIAVVVIVAGALLVSSYRDDVTPTPSETASPTVSNSNTPTPYPTAFPTSTSTATSTATSTPNQLGGVALNQAITLPNVGITLTPIAVVEESRCPVGVQCIQAGTVRLRTKVLSTATSTKEIIFTLNTPVRIGSSTIELASVTPAPTAGKAIVQENYRFIFLVR